MHGRALALVKLHSELSSMLCLRSGGSLPVWRPPRYPLATAIVNNTVSAVTADADAGCWQPTLSLTQCGHLTLSAALAGVFPIKLIAPTNRPTNLPPLSPLPSYLTLHRFSPSISASKEISRL